MTIARRQPRALDAVAPTPAPVVARPRVPFGGMSMPLGDAPAPEAVTPAGRLRRCTFRRIDRVAALPGRSAQTSYEVMCLYGGVEPMPLGGVHEARPVCEACTAAGVFRPDEE